MTRCCCWLLLLAVLSLPAAGRWDPVAAQEVNGRQRVGVPLGGIGAGAVELLTDGAFGRVAWQAQQAVPGPQRGAFLALAAGGQARILRLAGAREYRDVTAIGQVAAEPTYPTPRLFFTDRDLPVTAELTACSPLVPHQLADSSLPVALFEVTVSNPSASAVDVALAMAWPHLLQPAGLRRLEPLQVEDWQGLLYAADDGPGDPAAAQAALLVEAGLGLTIDALAGWDASAASLPWWPALVEGTAWPAETGRDGLVRVRFPLAAEASRSVRFLLAWHAPRFLCQRQVMVPSDDHQPAAEDAARLLDGNPATRWSTGRPMTPGDRLTLRLKQPAQVARLSLDLAGSPDDYPRGLRVETTHGRRAWQPVADLSSSEVAALLADGKLTVDLGWSMADQVRLVQLGRHHHWWWSLHEVTLLDAVGEPIEVAEAAGELTVLVEQTEVEDLGRGYAARFEQVTDVVAQVAPRWSELVAATCGWQQRLADSSLPDWLVRKLAADLAVLSVGSVLTADGRFVLWRDDRGALGGLVARGTGGGALADLFPALDQAELKLFAEARGPDGKVPETIGDFASGLAASEHPDLQPDSQAIFLIQAARAWLASGDRAWLASMLPAVRDAATALRSADRDGDGLPDIGPGLLPGGRERGPSGYTAALAVTAWEAAAVTLAAGGDSAAAAALREQAAASREALLAEVWTGQYLTSGGEGDPLCAAWQLAGDSLAASAGLPRPLPAAAAHEAVKQVVARCLRERLPAPAALVDPSGRSRAETVPLAELSAWLAAPAARAGFVDEGLGVLLRHYVLDWERHGSPGDSATAYRVTDGARTGAGRSRAGLASWNILTALAGVAVDLPARTLYLAPTLPTGTDRLRLPIFTPRFDAWLDFAPAAGHLSLEILAVRGEPIQLDRVVGAAGEVRLPGLMLRPGAVIQLGGQQSLIQPSPVGRHVGFTYGREPRAAPGLPTTGWWAAASGQGLPGTTRLSEHLAFDGQLDTRWTTGRDMTAGDSFRLDLGARRRVGRVELLAGSSRRDFPRGVTVAVSDNGATWRELTGVSVTTLDTGDVQISFPPETTRWLRLTNQGFARGLWWSIHELLVYE